MRIKYIPLSDFQEIINRNWRPVLLQRDSIPPFFQSMSDPNRFTIYASGGPYSGIVTTGGAILSGEYIVGGFDVYRNGEDDGFVYNMDHYVVSLNEGGTLLLVRGPNIINNQHWINDIEDRLIDAEILIAKFPSDDDKE